jgi:tetratricopeptide (TPR) repeat protein
MESDPEARAAAFHAAEKLAHDAEDVPPEAAAEKLIQAADILRGTLGDLVRAAAMLRRAVQSDPKSVAALTRLREVAGARADFAELSDVLELLQRRAIDEEERADLLAERGDVIGRKLGRFAEARSVYREVARITHDESLKRAAQDAAAKIDQVVAERRPSSTFGGAPWAPVAPARGKGREEASSGQIFRRAAVLLERGDRVESRALVDAGLSLEPDSEEGRALLRKILRPQNRNQELYDALLRLADRAKNPENIRAILIEAAQLASGPLAHFEQAIALWRRCFEGGTIEEAHLAEAIERGIGQSVFDIAARVLPNIEAAKRAEMLSRLAGAALLRGDDRAALELRAAVFFDAPEDLRSFQAAVEILRSKKDEENLARALELRWRATEDLAERRATLFELASLREALGQPMEAAEALLESVRISSAEDDVTDALSSIDRLSTRAQERSLLTRAHGAAAAREGLDTEVRARHLGDLAAIFEELGDHQSAEAARSEADSVRDSERDSQRLRERPVVPIIDPFTSFEPDPSARSMQNAGESDWSQAVEMHSMDTLIDRALTEAERKALSRARSEYLTEISGRWEVNNAVLEPFDGVRIVPPLEPADPADTSAPEKTPVSDIRADMAEPTPQPAPSNVSWPPGFEEKDDPVLSIRSALRRGQIDEALGMLGQAVVADESIEPKMWLDAGTLARAFGKNEDALRCFERAAERAGSPEEERVARRALSAVLLDSGAYREAALALIPALSREGRERERALELEEIGRLFVKDGDFFVAAGWLDDALNEDPACAEAAIALVRIHALRDEKNLVNELAAKVERAQIAMAQRARWLTALADARRTLGEKSSARDALALALVADPLIVEPAESLVALGLEAENAEWLDEGLRELALRSMARGAKNRGFLAAALLVARGTALEEDRATYESLRVALPSKPRAPIDASALLSALGDEAEPAKESLPLLRDAVLSDRVLIEVTDTLDSSLFGAQVPLSALGLTEALAKNELKKAIVFQTLRRYFSFQRREASEALLDRAALVVSQDPLIALENIGITTLRGKELIAFAVSPKLSALWSAYGLGLEHSRTVAKQQPGV